MMSTDDGIVQWHYRKVDLESEEQNTTWFKAFIQYNQTDPTIQFSVKRQPNCHRAGCLREGRLSTAINCCAKGIAQEAAFLCENDQKKANEMAQELRAYKNKSRFEISKFCVHLYTRETFLYRTLNQALRDVDHSKVNTLGPFCFLLQSYTHGNNGFVGTVYRGVDLQPEMIALYKQAKGLIRTWPSFISTSKSQKLAEVYGNTLFFITIVNIKYCAPVNAYDVSDISDFPQEEEVLLPAGITFRVIKVEESPDGKTIIEIEI